MNTNGRELFLKDEVCEIVAYLGPQATFTHSATRTHFGDNVTCEACETIGDVFSCVQDGTANYGVVPIENSTEGAVTHTLDQFAGSPLKIYAEIYLSISHNVLAKVPQNKITHLYSHPQVFGQCRNWLRANMPGVDQIAVSSTARAAEMAAQEADAGALASSLAAELYGLDILTKDIQDLSGNITRFLVISTQRAEPTGHDKTSVLFAVKHEVGALYGALKAFKNSGINMMKIESRPSKEKAWEYHFFVDIEGHVRDRRVENALAGMSESCTFVSVLGSYPNLQK